MSIQKITPFLWFDHQAEEAANFYCEIFPNSKVVKVVRNGGSGPGPAGSVLSIEFQIEGMNVIALNGGPHFQLNEAFSFVVHCQTQDEVDRYWEKLSAGGTEGHCGWLKDKFGLSWQITPTILVPLLTDPAPARSGRVMQAMLSMKKLDIRALQDAHAQA